MSYNLSESQPGNPQPINDDVKSAPSIISSARIPSLDVLRGIAVLGALLISIWTFGGFSRNMQNNLLVHPSGGNYRLFATMALLFQGKMRALIAIVFGAGMVLFLSKPNTINKVSVPDLFIRRQMWLVAFGLINGLLFLWTDDMLFHLGVTGILLFVFVRLNPRSLFIAAMLTTLIYCGKNYWRYADDRKVYNKYLAVMALEKTFKKDSAKQKEKQLKQPNIVTTGRVTSDSLAQKKDTLTKQQQDDKGAWEGMVKSMKYDPKKDDEKNKQMRSGAYGELWNHLLPDLQWREAAWTYRTGIWDIASMMFLGMGLFKTGFFTGSFPRRKYLLIALTAITAGLLLGWFRLYFNNASLLDYAKYISHHALPFDLFFPFERALMAAGYAALFLYLLQLHILLERLLASIAAVGEMALSNYLFQCIFLSLFFTGFGMTYFGKLQQYQLYLLVAEVWLVQIVFSVLWLRHFAYGPAEWLLRSLVYGKKLSINNNKKEGVVMPAPSLY